MALTAVCEVGIAAFRRVVERARRYPDRKGLAVRHIVQDGQKKKLSTTSSSCLGDRGLDDRFISGNT